MSVENTLFGVVLPQNVQGALYQRSKAVFDSSTTAALIR